VVDHLSPPQSIPARLEAFDRVVNGIEVGELVGAQAVGV
jgi:hypothetical protein